MRPNLSSSARVVSRAGQYWCNICQQACESDEALRQHYHQKHPEVAAKIEQLAARLNQGDTAIAPDRKRPVS